MGDFRPTPSDTAAFRRRVEACWKACQAIETEALEAGAVAELVAALEEAMPGLEYHVPGERLVRLKAALAALKPKGETP